MDISRWTKDFSWATEEASADNGMGGREFYVFDSTRGNVLTYPTIPVTTGDYYTREQACKNATLAAYAPIMLRRLAALHEHVDMWAKEDPDYNYGRGDLPSKCKQFREEIEDIFKEIERLTVHNLANLMPR